MELDTLTFGLICIVFIGVFVIGVLIYHIINISNRIDSEIKDIENKFPECPKCPKCPECNVNCPSPNCPKCPENPSCPENKECPKCPDCTIDCPSVEEIVDGVFPGRRGSLIGDNRFNVEASNSYDGLSDSNFYEQNYKFPMDRILNPSSPIRGFNRIIDDNMINNSYRNNYINTSESQSLNGVDPPGYNGTEPVQAVNQDASPETADQGMNQGAGQATAGQGMNQGAGQETADQGMNQGAGPDTGVDSAMDDDTDTEEEIEPDGNMGGR